MERYPHFQISELLWKVFVVSWVSFIRLRDKDLTGLPKCLILDRMPMVAINNWTKLKGYSSELMKHMHRKKTLGTAFDHKSALSCIWGNWKATKQLKAWVESSEWITSCFYKLEAAAFVPETLLHELECTLTYCRRHKEEDIFMRNRILQGWI